MPGYHHGNRNARSQEKGSNRNAAPAHIFEAPFHNPYTFIPFPEQVARRPPTPITIDEQPDQLHRKSGTLVLGVETISPLLTCHPEPVSENRRTQHKTYKALTIGKDVIVPATGIRGSLRSLMTIISGGTLGYMDEHLWLVQNRDARLGPSTKFPDLPDECFLAEVIKPGNESHSGIIRLGEKELIDARTLEKELVKAGTLKKTGDLKFKRPTRKKQPPLTYRDASGRQWRIKLSGRPIKPKGKREGLFLGNGKKITLPARFWEAYQGRHRHSVAPKLDKGDLVWLEPVRPDCNDINSADDIKSIQWARWGREGVSLEKLIAATAGHVLPDSMQGDGKVDMVTDLFGQIPKAGIQAAGPFAARIRPGNLIFKDAAGKIRSETLAPLSQPHPGCLAFYRDAADLDLIDRESPLKGYKVYRNTEERGENAPWKFKNQGVYGDYGKIKSHHQKFNKTAELLDEGFLGELRISFRALAPDELALLLAACSVDWKLGGGKPLGLGHCRVTRLRMIDEEEETPSEPMIRHKQGENLILSDDDAALMARFEKRISLYRASQVPVKKLRYPRAVNRGRGGKQTNRAGFAWFARHAAPRKGQGEKGLQTVWTRGELKGKAENSQIRAQPLPGLDPADPQADLLYGYDMIDAKSESGQKILIEKLEKFDAARHATSPEIPGPKIPLDGETRQAERGKRMAGPKPQLPEVTPENIYDWIELDFSRRELTPARAAAYLRKLDEFGISPETSKKWGNRIKLLKGKASK